LSGAGDVVSDGGGFPGRSLRLPGPPSPFSRRAARFRQLAKDQPTLTGYLALLGDLAEVQHGLWESFPQTLLPDLYTGRPPLEISSWQREPIWREALRLIAERLDPGTGPLAALCGRIRRAADEELESWAAGLLNADVGSLDPGLAPFVAAALQVYWTSLASGLGAGKFGASESGSLCPVCGSWPVASLLRTGGSVQGLRYLCCGLCSTEWQRPRIHCIHCGSSQDVAYFGIDGAGEAVKAEACAACKTYVKIMNREKDPSLDPFADDLATLALDLLMAEEGYHRFGFNPFLVPGG
jgi:FdhE protein